MEEEEVREGFICPICHFDLGTFQQLQSHYESVHSNISSSALSPIKGLLDKAKKKILKVGTEDEASTAEGASSAASSSSNNPEYTYNSALWDHQEEGFSRNHFSFFKEIRTIRTKHYFVEINKLLIRLDKLLSELPTDPAKRKAYEKSMVDWAPDEDVPLCPTCAQKFRLMRRKHHCRLCGSIMCNECSNFITLSHARKLTSSNFNGERSNNNISGAMAITPISTFPSVLMSLPRSGSLSSLNSIVSSSGELHIRICNHCKILLDGHNERMEMQNSKPVIGHLYDKLKSTMEEGEQLVPRYYQMVESLRSGATTYTSSDVEAFRMKLLKLAETIDVFSKKILLLGTKSDGPPPSARCLKLQKGIFLSANTFLKVRMLGLPSAPSELEIKAIRVNC
ncbi:Zinc finger, FYVE domain containing 20 [Chamberlinius hualienensis]